VEFKPNPNFERDLMRQVMRNLEKLRPTVRGIDCPDHPGQHPDLVREGGGLQIAACCKVAAELAAQRAGLGEVTWRQG
jgi:hypothetical protein